MVASRVTAVLGERQMMARLGGDEFAVLVPGLRTPPWQAGWPRAILEALRAPTMRRHPDLDSIGIALYPDDAADRKSLLYPRRYRALPRQDRRPQHLSVLRSQDGRRGPRTTDARTRFASRYRARRDATGVSAAKKTSRARPSPASKPCCAGSTRRAARYRLPSSSLLPRKPARSWRSATGCCKTACREAARWTQPLNIAVNVSAAQIYNPDFV